MLNLRSKLNDMIADRSGVVAVEAALLLPLFGIVSLGVMDSSYLLLQNHKMEQSVVSAANYMALSTDPRLVETDAKHIAVSGTTDPKAKPLIANWSIDSVSISYRLIPNTDEQYRGGDFIRVVDIQTSLPYEGFGFLKSILGRGITLNAQYQQRMTGTVI